jgi:hypothetical protein
MLPDSNRPLDLDRMPEPEHPTHTTKVLNKVFAVALLAIAAGLGLILMWSLDNKQVLTANSTPFPIRTIRDHPTAGGVVFVNVDYCKTKSIDGELRVSFVSPSREVFLPLTRERSEAGCRVTELPILIPKDIPADQYKIKFRLTYDKNPLKQDETSTFETQPVTVDPTVPTNDR